MSLRAAKPRRNLGPMQEDKTGFVYIMTNWTGRVLYTGVTNDIVRVGTQVPGQQFLHLEILHQETCLLRRIPRLHVSD